MITDISVQLDWAGFDLDDAIRVACGQQQHNVFIVPYTFRAAGELGEPGGC